MDISKLAVALKLSLSAVEKERNEASNYIKSCQIEANYLPLLLQISVNDTFTIDVRQNASIQLKNYVATNWKFTNDVEKNRSLNFDGDENIIIINEESKNFVRKHLLEIMENCTFNQLMKNYNQVLRKILKFDFDANLWPEFAPTVIGLLTSNVEKKVYAGVNAFYQLAKQNEFELDKYKENYNTVLFNVQPYLETILEALVKNIHLEIAAIIIKKILKIYLSNIQITIPKFYTELNSIGKWYTYFSTIIKSPIDTSLESLNDKTEEVLSKNVFWKIRNICFNILFKIFQKYGIENERSSSEFTKFVDQKLTAEIFNLFLESLFASSNKFLPQNITSIIFKFLNLLVERNKMIDRIHEILEKLLKEFIIQQSFLTPTDLELFQNNPKSYIYKRYDFTENFFFKRFNIQKFVTTICKYKRKGKKKQPPEYFSVFYNYFLNILKTFEDQVKQGLNPDLRIKEAVLSILQNLSELIDKNAPETIHELLNTFVIKEFESSVGIIRERACELSQSFLITNIKDPELFKTITIKILKCLEDKELPVRITAAIGIPYLLKKKEGIELLRPYLSNILNIYFKFMEEIDLDELLQGLESIVSSFGDDILDFSLKLVQELVVSFQRLVSVDIEEDDGEAQMASSSCLKTIIKIMDINVSNIQTYQQIEKSIECIIKHGLSNEGYDNLEDVIMLFNHMTSKASVISDFTWSYLNIITSLVTGTQQELNEFVNNNPKIKDTEFRGIGYDYLNRITAILINFIVRNPERIIVEVNGVSPLNNILYLFDRVMKISNDKKEEIDSLYMIKTLIALFDSLKGKIDHILETFLKFVLKQYLNQASTLYYKSVLIQAIAAFFIYDAAKVQLILDSNNLTATVFRIWLESIKQLQTEQELKRTLMGLSAVIANPTSQAVKGNISIIIKQIVILSKNLVQIRNSAKNKEEVFENEEEEEDEEERVNKIKKAIEDAQKKADKVEYDYDDDDEIEEETGEEYSKKDLHKSKIEQIHEFIYLRDALNHINQVDAGFYNELMGHLGEEDKVFLKDSMEKAELNQGK